MKKPHYKALFEQERRLRLAAEAEVADLTSRLANLRTRFGSYLSVFKGVETGEDNGSTVEKCQAKHGGAHSLQPSLNGSRFANFAMG